MSESKASPRKILARQRIEKAIALRVAGATLRQIADEVGVTRQRIHRILTDELRKSAERVQPHAAASLALELERLDFIVRVATAQANKPDLPPETRLKALDRIERAIERRSRLLGLNAPEKIAPVTPDGSAAYVCPTDEERAAMIVELLAKAKSKSEGE